jgi:ketosteroid isomerase-like protein
MNTDSDARADLLDRYFVRQNAMDLDGWLELLTDDITVLIPFAPANFPRTVEGKQAVAQIYRDLFDGYSDLRVDVHEVQLALDPSFATVRWHTHAELGSGGAYDNELIGTFRFRDGRISEITEYFNTVNFLAAIGAG